MGFAPAPNLLKSYDENLLPFLFEAAPGLPHLDLRCIVAAHDSVLGQRVEGPKSTGANFREALRILAKNR